MAYAGQTITNPITGEHITFVKTTADTNGEMLVFNCRVSPGKAVLAAHVHTTQEERFTVISGTLGVMVGSDVYTLRAGDKMVLPARLKHQWWNAGRDDVSFQVEVVPPRNLEAVLEAVCGMAHAGKLNKRAMPTNPFLLANLGRFSETYIPGIPIWMQKAGLAMGGTMAWVLGYGPDFAEYRTIQSTALVTDVAVEHTVA